MKEAIAIKLKTEWKKLNEKRAAIDHEIARFSYDVREQFPNGHAGRDEAIEWIMEELGRSAVAARSLIAEGESWSCVRSVEHWIAIGGSRSARILSTLVPKHRLIVLSEALAVADSRKRPVTAKKVRNIAWTHGFIEKKASRMVPARHTTTLIAFVNRLYATQTGLPPMPSEVRAIVKPKQLKALKALKAA